MADNTKSEPGAVPRRSFRGPLFVLAIGAVAVAVGVWRNQAPQPTPNKTAETPTSAEISPNLGAAAMEAASDPASRPIPTLDTDGLDPLVVEALESYLKTALADPSDATARGRLGIFYEAQRHRALAMQCYADATALDPSNLRWKYHWAVVAKNIGETDAAEIALKEVVAAEPDYGAAHEHLGIIALERQAYNEATTRFERVMELHPKHPPAYLGLARIALARGEFQEALGQLTRALPLAPSYAVTRHLLAQAYRGLGQLEKAQREAARAGKSRWFSVPDPWREDIIKAAVTGPELFHFASALASAGRIPEAVDILEDLFARGARYTALLALLQKLHLSRGDYEGAKKVGLGALSAGLDDHAIRSRLALTFLSLDDPYAALDHAKQAVRLGPDAADAHDSLGRAQQKLGRLHEALGSFGEAARLEPWSAGHQAALGRVHRSIGNLEQAAEAWEKALALRPGGGFMLLNLGIVYEQLGRRDDALKVLLQARELRPNSKRIERTLDRVRASRNG